MVTNITLNGGLILALISFVRLHEDNKARAAQKTAKKA